MIDLNEMVVFARVVLRGSFAAAARDFGVPSSTISRKVAALEGRLKVALLTRTTRSMQLTEVGRAYYESCAAVLALVEQADQTVMRMTQAPRGTLRVSAPAVFSRTLLAPTVAEYLRRYTQVRVEMTTEDRMVDLLREHYDLAFRVASSLPDTSLVARKLASTSHDLCASPRYLAHHPAPLVPEDLVGHAICAFGREKKSVTWSFHRGQHPEQHVTLAPRVLSANEDGLLGICVEGVGIGLLPPGMADADIARGRLQRLMTGYSIEPRNIYVIMPPEKQNSVLVRAYLEIVESFVRNNPDVFGHAT